MILLSGEGGSGGRGSMLNLRVTCTHGIKIEKKYMVCYILLEAFALWRKLTESIGFVYKFPKIIGKKKVTISLNSMFIIRSTSSC